MGIHINEVVPLLPLIHLLLWLLFAIIFAITFPIVVKISVYKPKCIQQKEKNFKLIFGYKTFVYLNNPFSEFE